MGNNDTESNLFAFLGVFLPFIGFLLVYLADAKNKYAMHYARQGLVLSIFAIIIALIVVLFHGIPVLGWIIRSGLWALWIFLWISGIVYALSGKEKDIPLIARYAKMMRV